MTARPIELIVIHCTATPEYSELPPAVLDQIHRRRGFAACGYHYYIRRDGSIHPMRPVDRPGAHARGYNARSIGIAYEGGLTATGTPSDTRTEPQRRALRALLTELRAAYPAARIVGHRDLSPDRNHNGTIEPEEWIKQCPCFDAIPEYSDI